MSSFDEKMFPENTIQFLSRLKSNMVNLVFTSIAKHSSLGRIVSVLNFTYLL